MMLHLNAAAPEDLDLRRFSNMTEDDYHRAIASGIRYVHYRYAVSLIVYSFTHPSNVHVVRGRMNAMLRGMPFTLLTFLLGWWSIPHGPVNSVVALITNLRGGRDVGSHVLDFIRSQDPKWQYGFR